MNGGSGLEKAGLLSRPALMNINRHWKQILPAGFLDRDDVLPLQEAPRYLQGLITRIERAEFSPAKDRKKAERLIKEENRLLQLEKLPVPSSVCKQHILQFRKMVEEFRISVFAPELGTRLSVSEKKLTAYWKDLEDACRRVE